MYEIKTSQYTKQRKVLIDGFEAVIKPLGAGSELEFSRTQRRIQFLNKRLEAGTISESELDHLDELEGKLLDFFSSVIQDATEDNHKVRDWLKATPLAVIQQAFDDMQKQFKDNDAATTKAGDDQQAVPTT